MSRIIDFSQYDAIIFDLGGVLLNIDYQASKRSFEALGVIDFDDHFSQLAQSHLFDKFETGKINASRFRSEIKKEAKISCSDQALDEAWNAMLLDFPLQRLELLEKLSAKIPLFLFSNTNVIHIELFKRQLNEQKWLNRFEKVFEKIYYSYVWGRRKPNPESFTSLLIENNLDPTSTLFIDDSSQHIEGAKQAGLNTILLRPDVDVTQLFYHE